MTPLILLLISALSAGAEEPAPVVHTYERVDAVAEAPPEGYTHWARAQFNEQLALKVAQWRDELANNPSLSPALREQFNLFAQTPQFTGADQIQTVYKDGKLVSITVKKDG